jgi:hypothetical protein
LHNFIIDNDSRPACCGQPANISADGEFDAEELEALGIQPLTYNLGAGGFMAVAYNGNGIVLGAAAGAAGLALFLAIVDCFINFFFFFLLLLLILLVFCLQTLY